MSHLSRRAFLGAAAASAVAPNVEASQKPDPLLDRDALPTFKFALEKSDGKVVGGNSAREATVKQLPVSKGLAGVSMRLEPGGMRELHWHATAAEWAYVVSGRCRTTVISTGGDSETNDFDPGDIWYFPRGHGHSIQCLGTTPTHFVLVFDNGYFSEFGTFSITDWLGGSPRALVAKNLGVPESVAEKFPKDEVYFTRGRKPPDAQAPPHQMRLRDSPETHKFRMSAQQPHSVHRGGREWRVGQEQFPISKTITGVILELEPGAFRELHWHPNADEWQYVLAGTVDVTVFGSHARHRIETLSAGDVAYIPTGYGHSIENKGTDVARLLIAFNTGTYQAIDLSTWIASNPDYLLQANFATSTAVMQQFPKERMFIGPRDGDSHPPG